MRNSDKKNIFLHYWNLLTDMDLEPVEEYNFDASVGRNHRFDFAFPHLLIAVEVNGNAWHVRGGGRHGQDKDLEKMNLAVAMGWRVFQFSPAMLNDNPERWVGMVSDAIRKGL